MRILYVERSVKIVDFGLRLKTLRKQAGLTQQQLAAQLGITKSVVSFYELQARSPSPEVLAKLAQIFHVSADYLLGLDTRDNTQSPPQAVYALWRFSYAKKWNCSARRNERNGI